MHNSFIKTHYKFIYRPSVTIKYQNVSFLSKHLIFIQLNRRNFSEMIHISLIQSQLRLQNIMDANHYNKTFRLKTEKAIEIINLYQNNHSEIGRLSLLLGNAHIPQPHPKLIKVIDQGKWQKMQFLQKQVKFVSLNHDHTKPTSRYLMKLIFRQFSGKQIFFGVSSKPEAIPIEDCNKKVRGQKIIKLPAFFSGNRELFITFHSFDISFFKFKFEFIAEENEKDLPERAFSEERKTFYNLPKIQNQSLYVQIKTQRSQNSLEAKQRLKSPKIQTLEEAMKGRLKSISQQKLKLMQAKEKKQDLSLFNQKSRQLREISKRCRGLLEQYEEFCREHKKKSESSYRSAVMLVIMSNFLCNVSRNIQEKTDNLNDAAHHRSILRRVAAHFMKINRNLKYIATDPKQRELFTIKSLIVLQAKSIHSYSQKTAGKILMDCFSRVSLGAKVNKALVKSTSFRAKIKTIQKYWQQRNRSQLASFQEYINIQIKDLMAKHPQFKQFYEAFYEWRIGRTLSWQYLKESSQKLKSIFGGYFARLSEIQEMREANQEIRVYNQQALKKHQKQYLQIPKTPSYPITRYFRDITHLKSMTRTWFEIQLRKQAKYSQKNKKAKKIEVEIKK